MRIGPVNRLKPYASALSTLIQKLVGQLLRLANAMPPHAQASAHTTARAMPALQRTVQFCAAAAGPAININTSKAPTICVHAATVSATSARNSIDTHRTGTPLACASSG